MLDHRRRPQMSVALGRPPAHPSLRPHESRPPAACTPATENGLVLRYRVEETEDGLSGEEGTFTICSFWLVSCTPATCHLPARHLRAARVSTASRPHPHWCAPPGGT
ncbi:hypothetical protein [Tenggerimyces flavus]|uniref:Uncharacterized protein n=1 Tax=Tenggerimyces flavus TaxID=1708749 RepID=A0ABV7Y5S2_9ACTN|nr:hypothetical protein [Tenggerimyces flavus]MBM7785059.1 hypothetical protein [Tenggerimyces flavus]